MADKTRTTPRLASLLLSMILLGSSSCKVSEQSQEHVSGSNKSPTINNQTSQPVVDEILADTLRLLDVLDEKLSSVSNKTPTAMMRDNLRQLDGAAELAANFQQEQNADHQTQSMLTTLDSSSSANVDDLRLARQQKRAKQLAQEESNQSASESTERHIKFTLELMQSIFASQSYSAKSKLVESFLISPLSIQMVLMMMHLGARGETRREIANCLHLIAESPKVARATNLMLLQDSSDAKLKRRHDATKATNNNNQSPAKQPTGRQTGNAHELFSGSMRNLIRDPNVMKALTNANQIFLQRNLPLSANYEWAIKHYYGVEVRSVDFQHQSGSTNSSLSADNNKKPTSAPDANQSVANQTNNNNNNNAQSIVNEWIEKQTKGKISNFLSSPISSSTLMMAINVLYFKGDWQYKFDAGDTENDAWFTQADGKTTKIPMMVNRLPLAFAHDAAMKTSVIELPYKAQRLGLFLLLPDEVSGIFHTMQTLNSSSFANLISSMRKPSPGADQSSNGINVRIPKFSIESSPRLSQILSQQLGLKSLFTPDMADLSGMFGGSSSKRESSNQTDESHQSQVNQVGLDELLHKAVLQVDEQGSVAAASSATIVERVGLFNSNYFEADHPFLLFLMDKQTGLVLFSGVFAGNTLSSEQQQQQSQRSNSN